MDPKIVSEIRANDKRIAQVGNRKIGYCGHVPQNIYFEQPLIPTCIHTPKMNVEPRPTPKTPADRSKEAADPLLEKLLTPCGSLQGTMGPKGTKHIPGYAGHVPLSPRQASFQGAANTSASRDFDGTASGGSSNSNSPHRSFPRYPCARGPSRKAPIGYDVFLTN
jgi:hypothetical protein